MNAVVIVIVVVVVLVVFAVAANLRARSVVKRHATTLSGITGIPAQQIAREMIDGNLTPGEWASRHGLDPLTFARKTELSDRIRATVNHDYPSERILAVSQGEMSGGAGSIGIAVTEEAVLFGNQMGAQRFEYPEINSVMAHDVNGHRMLSFSGFSGEGFSLDLVDADEVQAAINSQLAKITVHTERVELTPEGGALFRWRLVGNDYLWVVDYDPQMIGFDGQPNAEAKAAAAEATTRLGKRI